MYISRLLPVVALAAAAHAQVSALQVVANINAITKLSSQTNTIAKSIDRFNLVLTAPELINNLNKITTLASNDAASMGDSKKAKRDPNEALEDTKRDVPYVGSGAVRAIEARQAALPYTEVNQEKICNAFSDFVKVDQQLLATVIGKHGLLAETPFAQPIGSALKSLEEATDTLAFGIVGDVPTCAQSTTKQKNMLDKSLKQAVTVYNG